MKPLLFVLYSAKSFSDNIFKQLGYQVGDIEIQEFPDNETYVKINSDLTDRKVIFIATLDNPNGKLLPLLFSVETARDLGAKEIGLVAPYLSYMRQDKRFKTGEGVTSEYFGQMLSQYFDWMITLEPHLHRHRTMNEIYSIPAFALHATRPIAEWIQAHISSPFIVGPDEESESWVSEIANAINIPYVVLQKKRINDISVEISLPKLNQYRSYRPILVDDIISTGHTMIATIEELSKAGIKPPVCIGVHAIFCSGAYDHLMTLDIEDLVTCNTIEHPSNKIDVSNIVADFIKNKMSN